MWGGGEVDCSVSTRAGDICNMDEVRSTGIKVNNGLRQLFPSLVHDYMHADKLAIVWLSVVNRTLK